MACTIYIRLSQPICPIPNSFTRIYRGEFESYLANEPLGQRHKVSEITGKADARVQQKLQMIAYDFG
jgi:hypothetical protein